MFKSILFACVLSIAATTSAFSAEKLIRRGGFVDRFVLQNTTNPAFEGYIVIVLAGTEHKIVYQPGPANHNTFSDFCNVNDQTDPCTVFDPGPVYAEWDAATQVADGDLTPANRRKWLWAWTYQEHVKKAVKDVEDWLVTLSGLGGGAARRIYAGAMQAWGIAPADAEACAVVAINQNTTSTGVVCTYSATGLVHITGRIKRMVDDLDKAVIDLP